MDASCQQNKKTGLSQPEDETQSKSIKLIEDRIKELTEELELLKSELTREYGNKHTPNVRMDDELQKQVLMLTEAMPHMVWISDAEGRTTQANTRFYEFSGISPESDDGWSWVKVLHPEDLDRAIERGNQAALKNESFSMEVRCKSASGEYKWHLMHSIPFYDPTSRSTKWFGTTTSIEEQKDAQEKLEMSENNFRTMADAIPHIVFIADKNGKVEYWNHRFLEHSGFTEEQSKSKAWQLLIHDQDRDRYMEEWKQALATGDTVELEFRIKRGLPRGKKGNNIYLWHLVRAVALRDNDDNIEKWFGTWTEIDNQKRSSNGD